MPSVWQPETGNPVSDPQGQTPASGRRVMVSDPAGLTLVCRFWLSRN